MRSANADETNETKAENAVPPQKWLDSLQAAGDATSRQCRSSPWGEKAKRALTTGFGEALSRLVTRARSVKSLEGSVYGMRLSPGPH